VIQEDNLLENVREVGEHLRNRLEELKVSTVQSKRFAVWD